MTPRLALGVAGLLVASVVTVAVSVTLRVAHRRQRAQLSHEEWRRR